jgi:hypothetical protein
LWLFNIINELMKELILIGLSKLCMAFLRNNNIWD